MQALRIAKEGIMGVRSIRDKRDEDEVNIGYDELFAYAIDTDHGIALTQAEGWTILNNAPTTIDSMYTRAIRFEEGINDSEREAHCNVTWNSAQGNEPRSITLSTKIANWQARSNSIPPDWSTPRLIGILQANKMDNADIHDVALHSDAAYVVGSNSSQDHALFVIDITDTSSPSLSQSIKLTSNASAYDIAIAGDYAYIATDDSANELKIVDVSNPSSVSCCTNEVNFSESSTATIRSVAVHDNMLLLGRDDDGGAGAEIIVLDLSSDPTLTTLSSPVVITDTGALLLLNTAGSGSRSIRAIAAIGAQGGSGIAIQSATNMGTSELTTAGLTQQSITGGGDTGDHAASGVGGGTAIAAYGTHVFIAADEAAPGFQTTSEVFSYELSDIFSPGSISDLYNLGGEDELNETVQDMEVLSNFDLLFLATNTTRNSGVKHSLHILDVSDINNISSPTKIIYDGAIVDGYATQDGIAYRESDHSLFIVGGGPGDTETALLILKPANF